MQQAACVSNATTTLFQLEANKMAVFHDSLVTAGTTYPANHNRLVQLCD